MRTLTPLGGMRMEFSAACSNGTAVGATQVGALVAAAVSSSQIQLLGVLGSPPSVLGQPAFQLLGGTSQLVGAQTFLMSDVLSAFDSPLAGAIVRWPVGSSSVVVAKTPHPALALDLVEKSDVYAFSSSGGVWQQEYEVQADGTVLAFRSQPAAHVVAFATDGLTVFWSEASGATASSYQQPSVVVWSAPYTNNPAQLAATATKLASLPVSFTPGTAVAFQSLYATAPGPSFDVAYVVALADASIRQVSAGPGWRFNTLLLVSPTALWAIMNSTNGASGVALVKYALPAP